MSELGARRHKKRRPRLSGQSRAHSQTLALGFPLKDTTVLQVIWVNGLSLSRVKSDVFAPAEVHRTPGYWEASAQQLGRNKKTFRRARQNISRTALSLRGCATTSQDHRGGQDLRGPAELGLIDLAFRSSPVPVGDRPAIRKMDQPQRYDNIVIFRPLWTCLSRLSWYCG
jgi:hypothetical protein